MNWAAAGSFDEIWHSPAFPMWLTLAAIGFFVLILLVTLMRTERSVANAALTVLTLLSVGVAVALTVRDYGPGGGGSELVKTRSMQPAVAALPALSCIDDLAGDAVLAACEKALFGSPESAAAAVSYVSSQLARLTTLGDDAAANEKLIPEFKALRRALERDRYGLVAYVLVARDNCTPSDCPVFAVLTDRQQVVANMDAHVYEGMIGRYSLLWNAPSSAAASPAPVAVTGTLAGLPASLPTGRPTNADFPSAASTPAVSIMNPEPSPARQATPPAVSAPSRGVAPAAPPPAKKPPAPKAAARTPAPVQIAPPAARQPAAANQ